MSPTRMTYSKTMQTLHPIHPHADSRTKPIPCQPCFRTSFPETSTTRTTPWNDLCDEVLLPIGSLFVVFLAFGVVIWLS